MVFSYAGPTPQVRGVQSAVQGVLWAGATGPQASVWLCVPCRPASRPRQLICFFMLFYVHSREMSVRLLPPRKAAPTEFGSDGSVRGGAGRKEGSLVGARRGYEADECECRCDLISPDCRKSEPDRRPVMSAPAAVFACFSSLFPHNSVQILVLILPFSAHGPILISE